MVDNNEKSGQNYYNLNETDFLLLADLQREAFRLRNTKKDYIESLQRWKSVRMLIDARFEKTEREALDKIEEEFWEGPKNLDLPKGINDNRSFGDASPEKKYITKRKRSHQLSKLDEYTIKLRELMKSYRIAMTGLEKKDKLD